MRDQDEDEDEDAEELAYQERLRMLATEQDDPVNTSYASSSAFSRSKNTRSMDLKLYGVDMSSSSPSPSTKPASSSAIPVVDDELARAAQRARELVAQATQKPTTNKASVVVSSKKPSVVVVTTTGGLLDIGPPPGLPPLLSPRTSALAPPPGLSLQQPAAALVVWDEYFDPNHKAPYWHCKATQETTWINPHRKPPPQQPQPTTTATRVSVEKRPSVVSVRPVSVQVEQKRLSVVEAKRPSVVQVEQKRPSVVKASPPRLLPLPSAAFWNLLLLRSGSTINTVAWLAFALVLLVLGVVQKQQQLTWGSAHVVWAVALAVRTLVMRFTPRAWWWREEKEEEMMLVGSPQFVVECVKLAMVGAREAPFCFSAALIVLGVAAVSVPMCVALVLLVGWPLISIAANKSKTTTSSPPSQPPRWAAQVMAFIDRSGAPD